MAVLLFPIQIAFGLVVVVILGFMAQRLLGLRLGTARLILAGVFAAVVYPLITVSIVRGSTGGDFDADQGPEIFWFSLLGAVLTVLAAMAFIVVVEAFVPLGTIPPATVWGRGVKGRFNRARRYWEIVALAFRNGLVSYARGGRANALAVSSGRAGLGRTLTSTLNTAGVTFVKLGQSLATRRDLLPVEVTAELSSLQDQAEPIGWPEVCTVLSEELPAPIADLFAEFDTQPLAAASVGQVHLAKLHDGTEVVVKVQRPGIRPTVERDLDIAERLASRLDATTYWGRSIGIKALAEGLSNALREELDYRIEADNIVAVAKSESRNPDVLVPRPHLPLCTERVLVMERLHGTPIATLVPELDVETRERLAHTLLDSLLRQIVIDGIFHADPHAGNILVTDDRRLALLDFGSVGRLDGALREALQRLFLGVDRSDPLAVSDALLELVPRPDEINQQLLERDLGRFMAKYADGGAANAGVRMFGDLFKVVADHGLAIPPEIAAVFRCLATVEGTLTMLAPSFDLVVETKQLAGRYFGEQLQPDRLRQTVTDEAAALLPILRRLPRRVDRIASATESGRLSVNIRLFADERDRAVMRDMMHEVLLAFLAATTGLMSVLLIGIDGGPRMTDTVTLYAFIGYNFLAISAILALRVLAQIFRRNR